MIVSEFGAGHAAEEDDCHHNGRRKHDRALTGLCRVGRTSARSLCGHTSVGSRDVRIGGSEAESVIVDSSSWLCQKLVLVVQEMKSIEFGVDGLVWGSETEPVGS